MRTVASVIFSFLLPFSILTNTVSAQNPPTYEMLSSLRSGNPQRVIDAIEFIQHDSLTRLLYRHLVTLSTTNPTTQISRSRAAKASAFVLMADLDENGEALEAATSAKLRDNVEQMLLDMTTEVSSDHNDFQWRAVELMQFAAAYDFLRVTRQNPDARQRPDADIERNLAVFAANGARRLKGLLVVRNNLSLKLAAAVGYAAIVLDDFNGPEADPRLLLDAALTFIEKTIWYYQSDPSGDFGYSEGPYYFRYAMQNLIPFYIALDRRCNGKTSFSLNEKTLANPIREKKFTRLINWIVQLRQPDGKLPAFEDTYMDSFFPELSVLAQIDSTYNRYAWVNFSSENSGITAGQYNRALSRNFDSRAEFIIAKPAMAAQSKQISSSVVMPDAGYSVFRSSWTADATYFAMIGKHGIARTHRSPIGSGHKHANEGAFILHARGELLAIEPGYYNWSSRDSLIYGRNHNIILVDGKGADRTSYGTFLFGSDAYFDRPFLSDFLSRVSVSTSYQDADIQRTAWFFDNSMVILHDRASSSTVRSFTHQIHGNALIGSGFQPDYKRHSGSWTVGNAKLAARVNACGATLRHETVNRKHAPTSYKFKEHSAMYSTVKARGADFHTLLIPEAAGSSVTFSALTAPDGGSATACVSDGAAVISIVNPKGGYVDVSGVLQFDGYAAAISRQGMRAVHFCDGATEFRTPDALLFTSDVPSTAAWETTFSSLRASVEGVGLKLLSFELSYIPEKITGSGFSSWEMDGNRLILRASSDRMDINVTYSPVATSTAPTPAAAGELQLHTGNVRLQAGYPSPVTAAAGRIAFPLEMKRAGYVEAAVWDALGRRIATVENRQYNAGTHVLRVDVPSLRPGLYFIRVSSGTSIARQSFIAR